MTEIAIIFYSLANPDPVIERGFELARQSKASLRLIFLSENLLPGGLADILANVGFLGEKVKSDIKQTIIENYNVHVEQIIEETSQKAKGNGLKFSAEKVETEDFYKNPGQVIQIPDSYAIINYTKEGLLIKSSKYLSVKQLPALLNIQLEYFYDGIKES